jgi:hypothetical protein
MQAINMHVFEDADQATGYGFNYNEWDKRPNTVIVTDAVIVRKGTVQQLPTIDLICMDQQGNKHVLMITGRLLKGVVEVAFSKPGEMK